MKSEGRELHVADGYTLSYGKNLIPETVLAAHELKSPLAVMRQLALEIAADNSSPQTQRIAEQLQLLAERSLRLTSDLTKYHQLQTTLFSPVPVNVNELWRDVMSEAAPLYRAHGRGLVQKNKTRHPLVLANYDLLRRILLNFVDNALHYSDAHGVVELHASLLRDKDMVRLGVRDRGPAVPANVWKRAASRQLEPQPVHARPNSSGLGLAIVCEFAAAVDAHVGASRHRDGATFYVDVPISKQLSLL